MAGADTASSSGASFSHIGESEGLVMKHKRPWKGGRARIPKGKGKFVRPSRSWAPKFPLPLSTPVTKAKVQKSMTKSLFKRTRDQTRDV